MPASITVIIPTTCEKRREHQLLNAITSIQKQKNVAAHVLLVVNGNRFDPALLDSLRQRTDIQVEYQEEGSLPKALAFGRRQVETDFFCFLDDDDWLLEYSLSIRLNALEQDSTLDLAVTNGYNLKENQREIRVKNTATINNQPLMSLIEANWLTSCGGLFRSSTVGPDIFEGLISYYEWTLIAFRLCRTHKVRFIDEPTFVINDTPGSLSKTSAFVLADEKLLRLMLASDIPDNARTALRRKLSGTLHHISDHFRLQGHFRKAWIYHLWSLGHPGGTTYLSYTRRLLLPKKN